ncbi:hypothetical protein IFM89_019217 [Coptis chinensis]|uniref:Aluminum-activated malate transporter n=1 Tax=Coptis chinensis TaxID=261450 RepID=A0A835IXF1_9MAGN|nr:hypothetical protein IFM89_019217 [Coptis chinensis]
MDTKQGNDNVIEDQTSKAEPPDLGLKKLLTNMKQVKNHVNKFVSSMHVEKHAKRLKEWVIVVKDEVFKAGKEDPRRMVHSVKVGLALAFASLLYLLDPVFNGIGKNAIWAVLTVIQLLEFTAGETLYKGVNRGIGTLAAISLAFLLEIIARHFNKVGCAFFIGISTLIIGSSTTYARFISSLRIYDHGVNVFLLTFNTLIASGYHDQTVWKMMLQRIYAIGIGFIICLIVSAFILPHWSGEDLQNSITKKFEVLAELVEAHVKEYFQEKNAKEDSTKSTKDSSAEKVYQEILENTSADESLATFAGWEPRHLKFGYPWHQYLQLESALHHFGHNIFALNGCLKSQIQAPQSVRALFREPCEQVAKEVVNVLGKLADAIRNHQHCSPHISNQLHKALQELNASIKSQPRLCLTSKPIQDTEVYKPMEFVRQQSKRQAVEQSKEESVKIANQTESKTVMACLEFCKALPFAAFASLLVETAARLDLLIEEVEELGNVAQFKGFHEDTAIEIVVTSQDTYSKGNQKPLSK